MSNELIAVIGFIVTTLLSVNGYLFRGMVNSLNDIKLSLVKITSEHDHNIALVEKHEAEIDFIKERLHKLEGSIPSIISFLENVELKKSRGK